MRSVIAVIVTILLIPGFGCGSGPEKVSEEPDRVDCTLRDNFETGELFGWEAYPYAQDIGYDPTTVCQREPAHNGSRYALARIIKPNDALDLSEGFTRQIDLWTTKDTRLRVALFLIGDRKPEKVDLFLGLFDGRLYTHTVSAPEVNRWLELQVPAREFRLADGTPLKAGEHLQVVAVRAFYPLVSHLLSYTILIDDFSLNGERQRRFTAIEPTATDFEKFGISVLGRHYYHGDTIGISVTPEKSRKVTRVECALLGPDGKPVVSGLELYDDGTHGDKESGDRIWTNTALHTIGMNDPRGQWTIDLTGKTGIGRDLRWGFRFIMPGKRLTPDDHPRLFFSGDELATRLNSKEPPAVRKILENALAQKGRYTDVDIDTVNEDTNVPSESLTGGPYSRAGSEGGRWISPAYTLAGITEEGAWKYALAGDTEAGERAKKALLKFSSFKMWNRSWMEAHGRHIYFPVGYMTRQVAIGYDLLYPLMSDEERATVREGIMNNAIKPFYRDMVEMNRMPSSLSNHIAVIVAGLGLAATTIYGDDSSNPELEPYLSGILTKMRDFMGKTYQPEGSYGEPYTYQAMASRDLTETLCALERNFGIDYTTTTYLRDAWIYPLYATHSSGRYQDFGDVSLWYGMTQTHLLWLTHRMRNPWTYAYAKPFYEAGRGGFMGWLWYTDGIAPRYRTELPSSRLFTHKGNMVMRSDWSDEGSIMIFRCGPNSNHYHLDQGSFQILTNGEELLSDAGHSDGYYTNLYYPCYYTQSIGHTVMLVDMNPESQAAADYENGVAALRTYPHITRHFAGNIADTVEGDLTSVYKGAVSGYTRSLMFVKPDLVFLYDHVKSETGHEYDWLFHAEHTDGKNSITYENDTVTITRPKARLTMDILSPEIASSRIRASDRDEGFITLSGKPGQTEESFLAVLRPEALGTGRGPKKKHASRLLRSGGWIGAGVGEDGLVTMAMFRVDGNGTEHTINEFETDANRFAVTSDRHGAVKMLFVSDATRLTKLGRTPFSFTSSDRVSAAVRYDTPEGIVLEVEASAAADITMTVPKRVKSAIAAGNVSAACSYDEAAGTVTVKVPEGRTEMVMK
ncbi:heparinase II/III family protein [bacterium]|nr:heparinase II/III family protein [bacterium]